MEKICKLHHYSEKRLKLIIMINWYYNKICAIKSKIMDQLVNVTILVKKNQFFDHVKAR